VDNCLWCLLHKTMTVEKSLLFLWWPVWTGWWLASEKKEWYIFKGHYFFNFTRLTVCVNTYMWLGTTQSWFNASLGDDQAHGYLLQSMLRSTHCSGWIA
jgi:hypothetical protein